MIAIRSHRLLHPDPDSGGSTGRPASCLDDALSSARRKLGSRLEADLLACRALGCERAWLYAHGKEPAPPEALLTLERLVADRLEGRPIAQLCGAREFYGRDFGVDGRVLIPRPETELLIDTALALPLPERTTVCDVGTGSGCIAASLAAERPGWRVTGIDCSGDALAVAAENCRRLSPRAVELLRGDLLEPTAGRRFDLIVSNPPYIAADDAHLERGDLRFEPRGALVGGTDGLEVIRRLIDLAPDHLERRGWLLIEHGHDQASRVRDRLDQAGFHDIASRRDLAGIERVSLGRLPRGAE